MSSVTCVSQSENMTSVLDDSLTSLDFDSSTGLRKPKRPIRISGIFMGNVEGPASDSSLVDLAALKAKRRSSVSGIIAQLEYNLGNETSGGSTYSKDYKINPRKQSSLDSSISSESQNCRSFLSFTNAQSSTPVLFDSSDRSGNENFFHKTFDDSSFEETISFDVEIPNRVYDSEKCNFHIYQVKNDLCNINEASQYSLTDSEEAVSFSCDEKIEIIEPSEVIYHYPKRASIEVKEVFQEYLNYQGSNDDFKAKLDKGQALCSSICQHNKSSLIQKDLELIVSKLSQLENKFNQNMIEVDDKVSSDDDDTLVDDDNYSIFTDATDIEGEESSTTEVLEDQSFSSFTLEVERMSLSSTDDSFHDEGKSTLKHTWANQKRKAQSLKLSNENIDTSTKNQHNDDQLSSSTDLYSWCPRCLDTNHWEDTCWVQEAKVYCDVCFVPGHLSLIHNTSNYRQRKLVIESFGWLVFKEWFKQAEFWKWWTVNGFTNVPLCKLLQYTVKNLYS